MPKHKRRRRRKLRPWVVVTIRVLIVLMVAWLCYTLWLKKTVTEESSETEMVVAENLPTDDKVWVMIEQMKLPDLSNHPRIPGRNIRIKTRELGDYGKIFNDSNYAQYAAAEKLGIAPITDLSLAYHNKRPMLEITSNEFYDVDKLTHSMPYLVPEAALLLKTIGRNFIDSVGRRGGRGHKIIVTSLLRTPQTVKKLRRVNVNATDSSTHKFGTTFDISWSRFAISDSSNTVNGTDLKRVLGEVLHDLKRQNRCMVKYERKTACFHITALPLE